MSNRVTNFATIRRVFFRVGPDSSLEYLSERYRLQAISEVLFLRRSLKIFQIFLLVFLCSTCGETIWKLAEFNQSFPTLERQNHSKTCVLSIALSAKSAGTISHLSGLFFLTVNQNVVKMSCSFESALRKPRIALDTL